MRIKDETIGIKIAMCFLAPIFAALGGLIAWFWVCMIIILPTLLIIGGVWYAFIGTVSDSLAEATLVVLCKAGAVVCVLAYLNTLRVCITGKDNWFNAVCLTQDEGTMDV